jgi:hypothetical protein
MAIGARAVIAGIVVCVAGPVLAGCAPTVADGARRVFSVSEICPYESVAVRARGDLAPHAVLQGVSPPPGVSIDDVGDTYELSGCNKKVVMVCGNPVVSSHADPFSAQAAIDDNGMRLLVNTGTFTITRAVDVDGNRVSNVVVCQAATQSVQ